MRLRAARVGDDPRADPVREPGLHRCPLVRDGEVGEDGVAGANVLEVALDDLGLVALRPAAEVAAERVDRLPARGTDELGGLATVVVRGGGPAR